MNCPKCGANIKFYNLKPNCYNCGVNIMYYTQEADLVKDAKKAELEFASARIVGAKLKAAFIGGKLQIARLVNIVLIICLLLPPFAAFHLNSLGHELTFNIGGLGAYNMFSDGLLLKLPAFIGSTLYSKQIIEIIALLALFVVIVLLGVAVFGCLLLSFLNIKKSAKAISVLSFIAAGLSIVFIIASIVINAVTSGALADFSIGAGCFLSVVIFGAMGILNTIISKKDIEVKYRVNDPERKEILKKLKKGEISLDDLTLPVFETEEEKEARLKALEEALKEEEEGAKYE